MSEELSKDGLKKFNSKNFSLEGENITGHSVKFDDELLLVSLDENPAAPV